ncbi:hypothetical protein [Aureliella helgolandensis]|uniref:hypothetical protein n=1 Tax=Aureliella helgolandensis TaxID=2527968 RepID=UPI0018D19FE9|nr:hypothetical protein [Aureliella helgolandensis]
MNEPLNGIECPGCDQRVDEQAVACPNCGRKLDVEHPADITPTKHPLIEFPPPDASNPVAPHRDTD